MTEEKLNKAIGLNEKLSNLTDAYEALQDKDNLIVYVQHKQYYMPAHKILSPEERESERADKGVCLGKA